MMFKTFLNHLYFALLLLIPIGWVLNGKYYFSGLCMEGFDPAIALTIAIFLVLFASGIFACGQIFMRKRLFVAAGVCFTVYGCLAFYSINRTTAGQYADFQTKQKQTQKTNVKEENQLSKLKYLTSQRDAYVEELQFRKSLEREHLEKTGLYESTYEWSRTTGKIQLTNEQLEEKINYYQAEIDTLTRGGEVSVLWKEVLVSSTLYDFYAANFLKEGEENLNAVSLRVMFIFQVVLAVFLELIPQVGIFCFLRLYEGTTFNVSREQLHIFVRALWRKQKKSYVSHIPDGKNFDGLLSEEERKKFTFKTYRRLMRFLEHNRMITSNGSGFVFLMSQMSERGFLEVIGKLKEQK